VDWLEEFFPWLEEIDKGSGALEIALVVLIVGLLGVIGYATVRRRRPGATEAVEHRDDEAGPDGGRTTR
jgi:hypothetical protein